MNSNNNMIELQMELPIEHEKKVFGQFDEHIKILERSLAVTLISRDGVLKIVGPASNAARAKECLTQLLELSRRGNDINTQNVNYAISLVMEDSGSSRIPFSNIQKTKVRKSLFPLQYILKIYLTDGDMIKFRISKKVYGFTTQEENLDIFLNKMKTYI